MHDCFFDICAPRGISFESHAIEKMVNTAKSGPLPTLGGNSTMGSQSRTTEFESPLRYATLNGIMFSYL